MNLPISRYSSEAEISDVPIEFKMHFATAQNSAIAEARSAKFRSVLRPEL